MSTDKTKWQEFIEGVEQLMQQTRNPARKEGLRRSIRIFKKMMEHDEPWPGNLPSKKRVRNVRKSKR